MLEVESTRLEESHDLETLERLSLEVDFLSGQKPIDHIEHIVGMYRHLILMHTLTQAVQRHAITLYLQALDVGIDHSKAGIRPAERIIDQRQSIVDIACHFVDRCHLRKRSEESGKLLVILPDLIIGDETKVAFGDVAIDPIGGIAADHRLHQWVGDQHAKVVEIISEPSPLQFPTTGMEASQVIDERGYGGISHRIAHGEVDTLQLLGE